MKPDYSHLMSRAPWKANGQTYFINDAGEKVCTGARMGRSESIPTDAVAVRKLRLVRVPFCDGCYDIGGAYWGMPANLYCALGDSDTEQAVYWFRANSRTEAKAKARAQFPNATFFN